MINKKPFFLSFCLFLSITALGQSIIHLQNPSFEGYPGAGNLPNHWLDCGFQNESPPDTHPFEGFDVRMKPQDGNTYLGLVVRDNDTYEAVEQYLSTPLLVGTSYEFSVFMARSSQFRSVSRLDGQSANYTNPCILQIWGGNNRCSGSELLTYSPEVISTKWLEYKFEFTPKNNYDYIILQAFYKTPTLKPYNGNILLDNCSAIVPKTKKTAVTDSIDMKTAIEFIRACVGKENKSEGYLKCPKSALLIKAIDEESKINELGLRQYLQAVSKSTLLSTIRTFEALGFKESLAVLRETSRIYLNYKGNGTLEKEEFNYFDNADELFKSEWIKEDFQSKIELYFNNHKPQILEELKNCRY